MNKSEAAARLGIPEREVLEVTDSKVGTLVQTFDGNTYIVLPDDSPDAKGNTGVLFFVAPHPKYDEANGIPVYARHGVAVPDAELTPEQQWRAEQLRAVADSLDASVEPIDPAPVVAPDPGVATLIDDPGPGNAGGAAKANEAGDTPAPAAKPARKRVTKAAKAAAKS